MRRFLALLPLALMAGCSADRPEPVVRQLDPAVAAQLADSIRQAASIEVADGLALSLWAPDALAPDPIALTIDDQGRAYITRTQRQKNSEFDIRGHRDWMTASISWETVEDRRAFLREEFAPERSDENDWLPDLNGDSLHDWRDLAVEQEQVWRIEDASGDGVADRAQLFLEDFNTEVTDVAGALLVHGDDAFIGVAPDLWRLPGAVAAGIADEKESISHGYHVHIGFGAHGMSGLTVGPDGRIYWSIGDIGFNVVDATGKQWAFPNQGAILRANPDGSDFEVFAHGLRNTHEFVFDAYGNLVSVDNDGDHPGEQERVVYLVNGSDSGWRTNWQFGKYTDPANNAYKVWMDEAMYKPRHEGQAAYFLPPIANYHAGPAGMAYNPGTALGEAWQDRFFVAEFTGSPARSHVYAFQLEPDGAGFRFAGEDVVTRGILATGLDFGPDGALYVADWLDGWGTKDRGRIWKLDVPGAADAPIRQETAALLRADFEDEEADALLTLLRHADMRVRLKAQFELATRDDEGAEALLLAARQTDHHLARLHGLWGLGQLVRAGADVGDALVPFLDDADAEVRAQAAKTLGDVRYEPAASDLIPLLDDAEARVRFFATEALGRIGHGPALQPIVRMLDANDDVDTYLRHGGAVALARIGEAARTAAVVALRRLRHPGVARFLEDPEPYVVAEAARAINDDGGIEEALPALAQMLERAEPLDGVVARRALSASLRLGTPQTAERVASFAGRRDAPEPLRAEATRVLGVWPEPSPMDRVDGRFLGYETHDAAIARDAFAPLAPALLTDQSLDVQLAAADAAGRLAYASAFPSLLTLARSGATPEVRATALEALHRAGADETDAAVGSALTDPDASVRAAALALIPDLDLTDQRKADLLAAVLERGSTEEQQVAFETLGRAVSPAANAVLSDRLDLLLAGRLDPALHLDLIEAIEASDDDALVARLEAYQADQPQGDPVAVYAAALEGGDARRGQRIFYRHEAAQCTRCHATSDHGGGVGPNLINVGAELTRTQLLESLVAPGARLTPGYGIATLTLDDGTRLTGTVLEEADDAVVLDVGDGETRRVPADAIAERQNAPSAMPPMGPLLSQREIRDLVAYLVTLRGEL